MNVATFLFNSAHDLKTWSQQLFLLLLFIDCCFRLNVWGSKETSSEFIRRERERDKARIENRKAHGKQFQPINWSLVGSSWFYAQSSCCRLTCDGAWLTYAPSTLACCIVRGYKARSRRRGRRRSRSRRAYKADFVKQAGAIGAAHGVAPEAAAAAAAAVLKRTLLFSNERWSFNTQVIGRASSERIQVHTWHSSSFSQASNLSFESRKLEAASQTKQFARANSFIKTTSLRPRAKINLSIDYNLPESGECMSIFSGRSILVKYLSKLHSISDSLLRTQTYDSIAKFAPWAEKTCFFGHFLSDGGYIHEEAL